MNAVLLVYSFDCAKSKNHYRLYFFTLKDVYVPIWNNRLNLIICLHTDTLPLGSITDSVRQLSHIDLITECFQPKTHTFTQSTHSLTRLSAYYNMRGLPEPIEVIIIEQRKSSEYVWSLWTTKYNSIHASFAIRLAGNAWFPVAHHPPRGNSTQSRCTRLVNLLCLMLVLLLVFS